MRNIKYKNKICEKCGTEFTPTSSTQKWCKNCLYKQCLFCGKTFKVRNKAKFDSSVYCSKECQGKDRKNRFSGENAANYKNGNRLENILVKCSVCGKTITRQKIQTLTHDIFFCSDECKAQYYKTKYAGDNSPIYSKVEKTCEECGNKYLVYYCEKEKSRFCSKKCRYKWQAKRMKGKSHPNWQGGKANERSLAWVSKEYKAWRKEVFERDNYTCQLCGDNSGGNLNAHHIKLFSKYPELRYNVNNGITLCKKCHIKVHQGLKDIQSELSE